MADYLMLSWKKGLLYAFLLILSKATVLGGLITGVTATDDGYFQSHPAAKAVDGSGLHGSASPVQNHYHEGSLPGAQYLSNERQTPSLVFDLGSVFHLDEAHVWNGNDGRAGNGGTGAFGAYKNYGRGIHSVDILLSTNGVEYAVWKSGVVFPDAAASDSDTGFDLEAVAGKSFTGARARYVKLAVSNNWANGNNRGYTGLAEIKFYGTKEAPASALFLAPDDPRLAYSDYARLVALNADMARFDRIIAGAQGNLQYANPAARVRFRTNATNVVASFVTGDALGITQGTGVMLVDGVRAGTFVAASPNAAVNVNVPVSGGGHHTIELLLPYSQDLRFTGLTVNADATFEAPPPRPDCRWVAYGDSITEGFHAGDCSSNYPSLVAAAKNWEVVNMGFGWRRLANSGPTGADGTILGGLGADILTVLMGYNDANSGISAAQYRTNLAALVTQLRAQDPAVPVYLISPLYSANNKTLLEAYRAQIMDYVATAQEDRLFFVDGLALGITADNASLYLSDGIHPNNAGFALIAANLAPQLGATRNTGTPHAWLARYGFTNYEVAATNDADGDGFLTWQEYVADSDPTNAWSFLRITALSNVPPMTVYFNSSTGRVYGLQVSTNLSAAGAWRWAEGQSNRWGNGAVMSMADNTAGIPNLFYRLTVNLRP